MSAFERVLLDAERDLVRDGERLGLIAVDRNAVDLGLQTGEGMQGQIYETVEDLEALAAAHDLEGVADVLRADLEARGDLAVVLVAVGRVDHDLADRSERVRLLECFCGEQRAGLVVGPNEGERGVGVILAERGQVGFHSLRRRVTDSAAAEGSHREEPTHSEYQQQHERTGDDADDGTGRQALRCGCASAGAA